MYHFLVSLQPDYIMKCHIRFSGVKMNSLAGAYGGGFLRFQETPLKTVIANRDEVPF